MKRIFPLLAIISILIFTSCDPDRNLVPITEITGQWEAIEYHYNIGGGPDQMKELDPGTIYTFNDDFSFSLSTRSGCNEGTYTDDGEILILNYTCSNATESIQLGYRIFERTLSVWNITAPICTEPCSTKYRYLEE